jgi:beta-lactamase class A
MRLSSVLLFIWVNLTPGLASAASLNTICLNTQLTILGARASGRIGICVSDGQKAASLNGGQRFQLYNVVELPVAVAVLDAVDRGQIHLDDLVALQADDHVTSGQAQAKLTGPKGSKSTTQDLLVRMIADNDSTATDSLITVLGGPPAVESVLVKKGIRGFNIDRTERAPRSFSFQNHNTGTPIAVANLLQWLVNGWLLSPRSSALLLETMGKTHAFPDRLKAGLPTGWLLVHKSGSGNTAKAGPDAASDVGILMAPDARSFVVAAVFISHSRATDQDRATLIANVARAIGSCSQ